MENVPCTKQDTKNSPVDNARYIFEDNYNSVENFNASSRSYQPNPLNRNDKICGAESQLMGLRAEDLEI